MRPLDLPVPLDLEMGGEAVVREGRGRANSRDGQTRSWLWIEKKNRLRKGGSSVHQPAGVRRGNQWVKARQRRPPAKDPALHPSIHKQYIQTYIQASTQNRAEATHTSIDTKQSRSNTYKHTYKTKQTHTHKHLHKPKQTHTYKHTHKPKQESPPNSTPKAKQQQKNITLFIVLLGLR